MGDNNVTELQTGSFDPTRYPDRIGCRSVPSSDNKTATVEIEDVNGENKTIEGIPTAALLMLNMPKLGPQIPNVVRNIVNQGIGVALLWCRMEELAGEDSEDAEAPVKILIPTISGEIELTIRRKTLARKVT